MLEERTRAAAERLGAERVVGHRDLDPKNALWRPDGTPALVDWEAAGPVHPVLELVQCALDWSLLPGAQTDPGRFRALVGGYRDERPLARGEIERTSMRLAALGSNATRLAEALDR